MSPKMDSLSKKLLVLQDIELKLRDLRDPRYKEAFGEVDEERIKALEEAKKKLEEQIPRDVLSLFRSLMKMHGRAVAIVIDGDTCSNCFAKLPVGVQPPGKDEIVQCNICGLILYFDN